MPDYRKAVIYKIQSKNQDIDKVYFGSTCNFTKRKCDHKASCCNQNIKDYNYPVYKFIRDNGNWYEWEMIKIKDFPCMVKKELETEERKCMIEYGFDKCLNYVQPTRTPKEYNKDNKDKIKEYQDEYRDNNKDKIKAYKGEKLICSCGKSYSRRHKARHERTKKHQQFINTIGGE